MREIVTLQFGERSNYLGTHFWNTQVSCTASISIIAHHCSITSFKITITKDATACLVLTLVWGGRVL